MQSQVRRLNTIGHRISRKTQKALRWEKPSALTLSNLACQSTKFVSRTSDMTWNMSQNALLLINIRNKDILPLHDHLRSIRRMLTATWDIKGFRYEMGNSYPAFYCLVLAFIKSIMSNAIRFLVKKCTK